MLMSEYGVDIDVEVPTSRARCAFDYVITILRRYRLESSHQLENWTFIDIKTHSHVCAIFSCGYPLFLHNWLMDNKLIRLIA